MKEFLKMFYIEQFKGDTIEAVFGLIIWFASIFFICIVCIIIFKFADSSFTINKQGNGLVVSHYYNESYTTTNMVTVGNVIVPQTQYYGEEYGIKIIINNYNCNYSLNANKWNHIKDGEIYCFNYSIGRFSKSIYVKSLCD